MKDGVVFLNFSRDVLVDDVAMAEALASGKVAAYVTDFANPAVVKMERAIVIPHLGASTAEAEDNCAKMAVEEVMAYLERGEKIHCVICSNSVMRVAKESALSSPAYRLILLRMRQKKQRR